MRAGEDCVVVEISRLAALKLQSQVPAAKAEIARISIERQLLQMFGSGLSRDDVTDVVATAEVQSISAGEWCWPRAMPARISTSSVPDQ